MRKTFALAVSLGLVSCGAVSASPAPDVPARHWAEPAVRNMVAKKIMPAQSDGKFHGSKPVTRYELAVALDRFVRYIEAGRKPLHASSPRGALSFPVSTPTGVKTAMQHLSHEGFLAPSSLLFKGNGAETVTAQQLADMLAQVTIRLSDRTLPPDTD